MALRVLLADESTTIKKVMQLALQDFAVEVKAVHVGVDVVEVARSFQPDIIFADVLLQKKNGYDVCADLKQDAELKVTPVVLMWSSFMDLDEKQAAQCGAENRLEKPFDVESLRQLVLELVPKTRSQRLAHFLKFPDSFAGPLKTEEHIKKEAAQSRPAQAAPIQMPAPAPTMASAPAAVPPERKPETKPVSRPEVKPSAPIAASTGPTTAPRPESRPAARADIPPASARTPIPPPATPSSASSGATSGPASVNKAIPMPPPAKPAPAAASVSDLVSEAKSAWNMDSFDDISEFAEESAAPEMASETTDDEAFTEFKLTNLTTTRKKPLESSAPRSNAEATDDEDPWSHQDLSAFKIELPPVSIEGEDFGLTFDLSEKDPEGTGFLLNRQVAQKLEVSDDSRIAAATGGFENESSSLQLENDSDDLGQDNGLSIDAEGLEEIEMPEHYQAYEPPEEEPMESGPEFSPEISLETEEPFARTRMPQFQLTDLSNETEQPMQLDPMMTSFEAEGPDLLEQAAVSRGTKPFRPEPASKPKGPPNPAASPGKIPQLNADQLEEIIRSQSREIIESVVRRIVPDIASDIIKQELQRLLEETAIRETPGRETRR